MIVNITENSYGKDFLKMDDDYFEEFRNSKKENYTFIYGNEKTEQEFNEQVSPMFEKIYEELIKQAECGDEESLLYRHHIKYIESITKYSRTLKRPYRENGPDELAVDFIAGMTDDYFIDLYEYLFPRSEYRVRYKGYFE